MKMQIIPHTEDDLNLRPQYVLDINLKDVCPLEHVDKNWFMDLLDEDRLAKVFSNN